jgi:hypothetical protein
LYAPYSERRVRRPGWELAWKGADMRPFAFPSESSDMMRSSTKFREGVAAEARWDDDEAITLEGSFQIFWIGHGYAMAIFR